jgi:hypothetical protein
LGTPEPPLSLSEILGMVLLIAAIGAVLWYYRARD